MHGHPDTRHVRDGDDVHGRGDLRDRGDDAHVPHDHVHSRIHGRGHGDDAFGEERGGGEERAEEDEEPSA